MALKIVKLKHKPGIALAGPFASGGFYSQFNQQFARYLLQQAQYEVGIFADEPIADLQDVQLNACLKHLPHDLKCQIEHRSLPVLHAPDRGHWVLFQPWEYGSTPVNWQKILHESVDDIWVHTPQNKAMYVREGISEDRVFVVPPALDTAVFHPEGPALPLPEVKGFKFLFVGESLWYSGLDILLQAYSEEFLPDEAVSLVVLECTEASVASRQPQLEKLHELQAHADCAPIVYLDRQMSSEERAALYRACDAFVYPCRAEAFATQIFEAAACALPLILSDLEGHYGLPVSADSAITYVSTRLSSRSERMIGGIETLSEPIWSEPNLIELRRYLRQQFEAHRHSDNTDWAMARQALSDSIQQHCRWSDVLAQIAERLQSVLARPLFREQHQQRQEQTLEGFEALQAGDSQKAIDILHDVLAATPNDPVVLLDLIGIYLQNQQYANALPLLERALPLAPQHVNLYHSAAISLFHLGAYRLALAYFHKVLSLQGDHQGALASLPVAQIKSKSPDDRSAQYDWFQHWLHHEQPLHRRQTLSLCMIVKNEAQFLQQCLESVQSIVDEIIIVDTGSTDNTLEIASEFDAKLYEFEWTGDFSEARNQALEQATCDWILVLDADEIISPETLNHIPQLIQMPTETPTGYQVKIRNLHSQNNDVDVVEHYMLRLFPNHPQLRFKGMIHEQLGPTDPQFAFERLATPDVLILHYGYTGEIMDSRDKFQRNYELIQAALQQEPDNPFHWFNLGLTYRVNQDSPKALECFYKAVEMVQDQENIPTYMAACYSYIASLLIEKGDFQTALEISQQAPELSQQNPDYWVNLGSIHNALGQSQEALNAFEKAMSMRAVAFTAIVSDRAATTWKPYAGIGNTYLMMNQLDKADYYFRRALKENSHNPDILLGLGRLALMRQQADQARDYFLRLQAHPQAGARLFVAEFELARAELLKGQQSEAEARLKALLQQESLPESLHATVQAELSQIYLRQNRLQEATQSLTKLSDSDALMQAMARYYFQQGAYTKILAIFDELIQKSPTPRAMDYRHRGAAYLYLENLSAAEADFKQALALDPTDAAALHNLGVIAMQQDDIVAARQAFEAALQLDPALFASLFDLAKLDIYQQDLKTAHEKLLQARKLKPRNLDVLETLAYVEYAMGQSEQASSTYMDVLDLNPRHTDAMIQLAYILSESGEAGRAIQLFEKALTLGVQNQVLYNGIGMAFLTLERYEDARNAFLLALQFDPENHEIQKAVALADQLCGQSPLSAGV